MDNRIAEIISGKATITIEELEELNRLHPYFSIPAICALRDKIAIDDASRKEVMSRIAMNASDRTMLSDIIEDDCVQFTDFYPMEESAEISTTDTIDTFLEKYGNSDSREIDALTKMIFNPMPDYASVLATEEKQSTPSAEELDDRNVDIQNLRINRFISEQKQTEQQKTIKPEIEDCQDAKSDKLTNNHINTVSTPQESENTSLTESFAKVMIKNRNYSKALEIITNLSLNNPEKSIYFADQIRFLQKLIINENKQ